MVFSNFLNFFALFLEFSISRRVGTKRNDNFYFLSFTSFLQLFLARNEAIMVCFKSLNFFANFFEFSISRRVGTKRNYYFYLLSFSSFLQLFLARNEAIMVFFNSLNFFAIIFNFLFRVGLERNGTIIFIFSLSRPFPTYFGLE